MKNNWLNDQYNFQFIKPIKKHNTPTHLRKIKMHKLTKLLKLH